jgi:hypothetical protein
MTTNLSNQKKQHISTTVARWFVFKPKIPTWVISGGLAMENLGIFYDHLVYLQPLEILYGHLV